MRDAIAVTADQEELDRLQAWYASQCNGDWEHQHGIRIYTLDNPGWAVDIDLSETAIQSRPFTRLKIDRNEADWVHCTVENVIFKGRGGPGNLRELVKVFLRWAE